MFWHGNGRAGVGRKEDWRESGVGGGSLKEGPPHLQCLRQSSPGQAPHTECRMDYSAQG